MEPLPLRVDPDSVQLVPSGLWKWPQVQQNYWMLPEDKLTAQVTLLSQRDAKVIVSPAKGVGQEGWKGQDDVSRSALGWKDGGHSFWTGVKKIKHVLCLLHRFLALCIVSQIAITNLSQSDLITTIEQILLFWKHFKMIFLTVSLQYYF